MVPTVCENYEYPTQSTNHTFKWAPWDTCGHADYSRLRPLSYPNSDIVGLCFSVDNVASLEDIVLVWCVKNNC